LLPIEALTSTVTQIGPESARSPSPKSRKISGGIGLPSIVNVRRTSVISEAVCGASPAEAGMNDMTINAAAARRRDVALRFNSAGWGTEQASSASQIP
jgi:hypothetical protein